MSEFNVLVSGKAAPNVKGSTISKEENLGTESAAMEFAAILSGWMTQAMGQGQNSEFQSSDPAGKEANSGQTGIQGIEGMLGTLRTVSGLNWGSTSEQMIGQEQQGLDSMMKSLRPEIMTLLSQENLFEDAPETGIGSGQLQTGKLPLSELDQYRVLITKLLQEMNGEISKVSIKPAEIQGLLTQLSQELNLNASVINTDQSSLTGVKTEIQPMLVQLLKNLSIQNIHRVQTQSIKAQSDSNQSTGVQEQGVSVNQSVKSNVKQIISTTQSKNLDNAQAELQYKKSERTIDSNLNSEEIAVQSVHMNRNLNKGFNVHQDRLSSQTQDGVELGELTTADHLLKMNIESESGQHSSENKKQNLFRNGNGSIISKDIATEYTNSDLGNFSLSSTSLNSVTEIGSKTATSVNLPIWQQVAQELQSKVLNQLPKVREFNIQLHPAELGQISISVALDNGQVHFQMRASEAATGQILQNSFPELRDSLSQSGVQCGMMQMSSGNSNPNFNQGRNQTFNSRIKNQDEQGTQDNMNIEETLGVNYSSNESDLGIRSTNRINVTA